MRLNIPLISLFIASVSVSIGKNQVRGHPLVSIISAFGNPSSSFGIHRSKWYPEILFRVYLKDHSAQQWIQLWNNISGWFSKSSRFIICFETFIFMILKTFSSQRHKINTFDEKPSAASRMQLYINDLKDQIEFSRQFFDQGSSEPSLKLNMLCWINK